MGCSDTHVTGLPDQITNLFPVSESTKNYTMRDIKGWNIMEKQTINLDTIEKKEKNKPRAENQFVKEDPAVFPWENLYCSGAINSFSFIVSCSGIQINFIPFVSVIISGIVMLQSYTKPK